MARRRAASKDVCPLELKSLRTNEDAGVSSLDRETETKSSPEDQQEEERTPDSGGDISAGVICTGLITVAGRDVSSHHLLHLSCYHYLLLLDGNGLVCKTLM